MGYGFAGSISPKAGKKLAGKLAVLKKTRAQKSKMAGFDAKSKDEGAGKESGKLKTAEINNPATQAGGRPTKGGGVIKPESQVKSGHIDQNTGKKWPNGGGVSASNPKTGNTRMKGPIAKEGGQYGGGGRDTQ